MLVVNQKVCVGIWDIDLSELRDLDVPTESFLTNPHGENPGELEFIIAPDKRTRVPFPHRNLRPVASIAVSIPEM